MFEAFKLGVSGSGRLKVSDSSDTRTSGLAPAEASESAGLKVSDDMSEIEYAPLEESESSVNVKPSDETEFCGNALTQTTMKTRNTKRKKMCIGDRCDWGPMMVA